MKRGKDDEKIMEPMFPRLHVNDTEKGGPRAPPRNKMALYEQLTIPSQRYNSGAAPPTRQNSTSNLVPSTSTSQGTSGKRKAYFPLYQPPSAPAYEEIQDLNTEALNLNSQPLRLEEKKKALEEDDFMVPIFSECGTELHNENMQNNQRVFRARKESNQSHDHHLVLKQLIKDGDGSDSRVSPSTRISLDISTSGRNSMPWQKDVSLTEGHGGTSRAVNCRSDEDDPDLRVENSCEDTSLRLKLDPQTGRGLRGDDNINRGIGSIDAAAAAAAAADDDDGYLEKGSIDKGDDVSETSMVDSASELDITPDDVVDIIGQKHFWKARTAIVNQQRVFAVQVFELHRLLKVQKLIAGSPNLLLEVSAFEGKSPLKGSSVKYSSEYVVKALPHKGILKDVPHKITDKVEGTAENAVPKAAAAAPPIAAQQHPNQPAGYPSFSGNMDPKVNPWGFHQPSAHQWLVPVMTPSEGLIYKPYPAPGFMGPVCGGYGPVGPNSMPSNLMNPPYVAQTQQYHQQPMGMPPGVHFGGPGYFPPYGMHMMGSSMSGSTVDQLNPSFGSNAYSQGGQPESSPATRFGAPMPASAPTSDRATAPLSEGRDEHRLFRSPPTSEAPMDTPVIEKQSRVIRAVPHRSTNDSAARIFQSIQQERQLYESR